MSEYNEIRKDVQELAGKIADHIDKQDKLMREIGEVIRQQKQIIHDLRR